MLKAIIIDDEIRAQRVLQSLLQEYCTDVEVVALCSTVPEGVLKINQLNPDVVFCDIEMPEYSGFELLSFFSEINFELIFATGYSDYAIQAFEVSAIDYIMKPIQIDKLVTAIDKVKKKMDQSSINDRFETLRENLKGREIKKIALPIADGLLFVRIDEINLLEADGSYTLLSKQDDSTILVSKKLKFFEDLLENRNDFFRVHRSSIVNINCIKKYSKAESYILLENGKTVKIARDKKAEFEAYVKEIRF